MEGEEGGSWGVRARAASVASVSWPAKTEATCWGLFSAWSASATEGRAAPAAHPQTELKTSMAVPGFSKKESTS